MRIRLPMLGIALGLSVLIAACGGGGAQPAAKQELTVGASQDLYVLEGPRASLGMYPLNANIVETLAYLGPNYEVKPLLAERWEFRQPNTWRFFLRKGVKFHDGQPFNAAAVKAGLFDRVAKIPGGSTILAGPSSAVVVDDYTIDFTPIRSNLRVPEQIVHPNNGVIAPGSDPGKKPVGTGPFRFVEYATKERIVVDRNPDYWGARATLTKITFRFYPDAASRLLALQSGNVDAIFDVSRPDVQTLQAKGFTIKKSVVGAYEALYANVHGRAPFDILQDLNVRQAVTYAIDRKSLVTGALDGQATTDQTMVPPSSLTPYTSTVKGYAFDQSKAKALLDAAGWKPGADGIRVNGGRRLKLTVISGFPSAEVHRPVPSLLQAQLKQVGIEVEIVERPDSASYQSVITSGQGDLYLEQGNQNDANPGFLPVLLFYVGGSGATADYQSLFAPGPKFDQVLGPSLTESDPNRVRMIVAEAMHQIIDEDAIVMPLAGIYRIYGLKKTVQGFTPHPSSLMVRWDGVSLSG